MAQERLPPIAFCRFSRRLPLGGVYVGARKASICPDGRSSDGKVERVRGMTTLIGSIGTKSREFAARREQSSEFSCESCATGAALESTPSRLFDLGQRSRPLAFVVGVRAHGSDVRYRLRRAIRLSVCVVIPDTWPASAGLACGCPAFSWRVYA